MELERDKKIEVIKKAIKFFKMHKNNVVISDSYQNIFNDYSLEVESEYYSLSIYGMCDILGILLTGDFISRNRESTIRDFIPEFIKPNYILNDSSYGLFWFPKKNVQARINYLEELLEKI